MPGFLHFLRCVGKAVVKNAGKALAGLFPFGETLYEVARDTLEDYRKGDGEAQLRADLEGLAQASQAEVQQAAEEIAAGHPPEVRQALAAYLTQVPAAIRKSLRRPADPSGTTVPVGFSLKKPEDLVPFLPVAMPRFKPGDRPLAADWGAGRVAGQRGLRRGLEGEARSPVAEEAGGPQVLPRPRRRRHAP